MKYFWVAVLLIGMIPATSFADRRYDRGDRYRGGHRHSSSSWSLNFGFGSRWGSDFSYGSFRYGHRPVYRDTRYYGRSYYYAPPPVVIYREPAYYPPPVIYRPAPTYYYDYCPPRYYGGGRYYYR